MNTEDLKKLNGEQLLHKVWVVKNGRPIGILDQTISDIARRIEFETIVKIEPQGGTAEGKIRECKRWGCE